MEITASENGLCTCAVVVVVVVSAVAAAAVVVVVVKGVPVAKICLREPVNIKRNHSIHSTTEVLLFSL